MDRPSFLFFVRAVLPERPPEASLGGAPEVGGQVLTKTSCSARLHCAEWSCVVLSDSSRHHNGAGRDWPDKSPRVYQRRIFEFGCILAVKPSFLPLGRPGPGEWTPKPTLHSGIRRGSHFDPRPSKTRRSRDNARIANMRRLGILLATCTFLCAQIQTGPPLPYRVVEGWSQLPAGWNFGEVAAVDVDTNDNVCAGVKGEDRRARACSAGACRRVYRAAVGSAVGSPRLDGSWERVGALGNCCHWREPSFRKLPGPTVLEPGRGRLRQPPIDQFCMSALLSSTNRLLRLM